MIDKITRRPVIPTALRLTRLKAPLTDIRLLAPVHRDRSSSCALTYIDSQNNAFNQAFSALGDTDSIRVLDRATAKVDAWADAHDDRAVVVSAGRVFGATIVDKIPD